MYVLHMYFYIIIICHVDYKKKIYENIILQFMKKINKSATLFNNVQ